MLYLIKNIFKIKNRYEENVLACDTESEMEEWIICLQQRIEEILLKRKSENTINLLQKVRFSKDKENKTFDSIQIEASLKIKHISLCIFDKKEKWLEMVSKNVYFLYNKQIYNFDCQFKLESLKLVDWVYEYCNPEYNVLFNSQFSKTEEQQLIVVDVHAKEPEHSEYHNKDLVILAEFGNFLFNWKPDTLIKIGVYISIFKRYQKEKEEKQLKKALEKNEFSKITSSGSLDEAKDSQNLQKQFKFNLDRNLLEVEIKFDEVKVIRKIII